MTTELIILYFILGTLCALAIVAKLLKMEDMIGMLIIIGVFAFGILAIVEDLRTSKFQKQQRRRESFEHTLQFCAKKADVETAKWFRCMENHYEADEKWIRERLL